MSFQQFLNILWSRKRLAILLFLITVTITMVVSLILPKEYLATTALVVDHSGVDPITGLNLPGQLLLLPGYMETQVDVISSHNVALKVVDRLKLAEDPEFQLKFKKAEVTGDIRDWLADELLEDLDVQPSKESSVIQLSYSADDPQFSALVSNAFAQAYMQTTVELRTQPAKQNAEWFDKQMALLREQLAKAQDKLSVYQQEHGIIIVDERLDLESDRLAELSHQLAESQAKTYELLSRKDQYEKNLVNGNSPETMEEVLNNPLIQDLKADFARAEAEFAHLSTGVHKNYPQYRKKEAEVISLRNKIRNEIKNVHKGIESNSSSSKQRDDRLVQALAAQKAKVLELKQQRDQIDVLSREVENAQKSYDNAMQRSVQTRMESEISQTNIAVLNSAIPPAKPAKPKLLLNLLLSVFLGSMLGVGMALLAELIDRRVRSPMDVAEILELPVLGVLVARREHGWFRALFLNITKHKPSPEWTEQGA